MSRILSTPIGARRQSCAQTSTHLAPFLLHPRRRDISVSSDSKHQGNSVRNAEVEPTPSRETGGQQLGPQASDPPEGSGNERPPDQRPMLVRIIMSVFRSFWQSLGRVWEVLPGSKAFRLGFCLFVLALYNVRSHTLATRSAHQFILASLCLRWQDGEKLLRVVDMCRGYALCCHATCWPHSITIADNAWT